MYSIVKRMNEQEAALMIEHVLAEQMNLDAPVRYLMTEDGPFTWLLAIMDVPNLSGPIGKYTSESVRHHLSTALGGLPVALSNSSGLRYAVLLSGRPHLPRRVEFPGLPSQRDTFALGKGLRGEIRLTAKQLVNVILGGSQESGKSNLLRLLAHTARQQGARLYLVDPVQHTFNPDLWNGLAAQPVASRLPELLELLERLKGEVIERSYAFREAAQQGIAPEDLDAYNQVASEPLPRVYLMADEFNTFASEKSIQEAVADLARIGRKWGLHLVLAGHNWRSVDIPRGLSAMFPTRICLRVADDTSGNVTLGNTQWGRRALRFKLPGRAVIFARGQYQVMQSYFVTPETEGEWSQAGAMDMSILSEQERALVRCAVDQLNGGFVVNKLAELVEGVSAWQVRKIAESWEKRGWLEAPADATSPRRVSDKLAGFARKSLIGTQASQGHIGCSQATQGLS